jgi:hypothetical protein
VKEDHHFLTSSKEVPSVPQNFSQKTILRYSGSYLIALILSYQTNKLKIKPRKCAYKNLLALLDDAQLMIFFLENKTICLILGL